MNLPKTLYDEQSELVILDQTLLPREEKYLSLYTAEETAEAIRFLRVRGAPAIGAAAACAYYLEAKRLNCRHKEDLIKELAVKKEVLHSSRPTAVNLFWALSRMERAALNADGTAEEIKKILLRECAGIIEEEKECCRKIGE